VEVGMQEEEPHPYTALLHPELVDRLPLWSQDVSARILDLVDRLDHVQKIGPSERLIGHLDAAARLVVVPLPRRQLHTRLLQWWNGSRVERAWMHLREAEILLIQHGNEEALRRALVDALAYADRLPNDDASRQWLFESLQTEDLDPTDPADRNLGKPSP
jgi:hypothetical protein